MTAPPGQPKIYHITHIDNLTSILADGAVLSDAGMLAKGGPQQTIGMSAIKRRRIEELQVDCHPGTKVGDYVPFYFCPRSVMLYVISRQNHLDLAYQGGQEPIVHLEADLHGVMAWAEAKGVRWAYSLSNAGARYTMFRASVNDLNQLDWESIAETDFSSPRVKECKQAEFLLHGRFPFELVDRIGVCSSRTKMLVGKILAGSSAQPVLDLLPSWYF